MNDVLALPFDQYQRYRIVADLLSQLREGAKPLSILDVAYTGVQGKVTDLSLIHI